MTSSTPPSIPDPDGPYRFAIVGRGWRSQFFLRIAAALPDRLTVTGVLTRTAERGRDIEHEWGVPTFRDIPTLIGSGPEFVISSVPWDINPPTISALVAAGMGVLAETPPAPTVEALRTLWAEVGASGLVQVAEQYQFQPLHAVRIALARSGLLGRPTAVHMSSTHGYHAMSLIRLALGVGFAEADVSARTLTAPLLRSVGHGGWPAEQDDDEIETVETIATLDFGNGRSGLYDFTDNQWWHPLRRHRHVIRGTRGEIVDTDVTTMADIRSPVTRPVVRRQAGIDSNLEGMFLDTLALDGRILWRNPFAPVRLADEDIAIADLLVRTGSWTRNGTAAPYPLSEASQDHLLSLAIAESARTGTTVHTGTEPWAE
jgi:predicted dehydrogenase